MILDKFICSHDTVSVFSSSKENVFTWASKLRLAKL